MEDAYRGDYLEAMSKGVEGMWLKQRYTDVVLKVGGKAYNCHKVLLGSLSNYFKELFMQETDKIVEVKDTDNETFEAVLQYIYAGRNDQVKANVRAVLKAAVRFQIPCLQDQCESILKVSLSPDTCIRTWRLAARHGCSSLAKQSLSYVLELFPVVMKSAAFGKMNVDELITIINDDDLNTPSEEAVCEAVMSWMEVEPENRLQFLERLFAYIRFPLIDAAFIETLTQNPLVSKSEKVIQLLNEVKAYHSTGATAGMVNPRQFHHRTEEMLCAIGKRSRHPNPEATEIKCFSFNRAGEHVLASLPAEPGACFAVCSYNNDVYVSGGYLGLTSIHRFVTSENRWQTIGEMKKGRWGHSMEAANGAIYVFGGSKKVPKTLKSIEKIHPVTGSSEKVCKLAVPVSFMATAVIGDKVYIFGGKQENRSLCQKIQCFDPATNVCTIVGDMPMVSSSASRVAVLDSTAYVFYGQGQVMEFKEGMDPIVVASIPQFDQFGVVGHNDQIIIDGIASNQTTTLMFDPKTHDVTPFNRTIKVALCNFTCMNIVMSKKIVHMAMQ